MPKFVPRKRKNKLRDRDGADTNVLELRPPDNAEKEERRRRLKEDLKIPKVSTKKAKRLEKYIETKLRHEENQALIKKLSQAKVDTTSLRSSKRLGQGNNANIVPVVHETPVERPTSSFGAGLKRPLELDEHGNVIIKRRKRVLLAKLRDDPELQEESDFEGFGSSSGDQDGEQDVHYGDESSDDEISDSGQTNQKEDRTSAFKAWAIQSRNNALGFTPSTSASSGTALNGTSGTEIQVPRSTLVKRIPQINKKETPAEVHDVEYPATSRVVFNVPVDRKPDIEKSRIELPVVAEEQRIMEAIHNNDCTIIYGATGSGKTTQVPQFLFEAGYGSPDSPTPGMIGITQPRRVAAVSMAKRVGTELGSCFQDTVSHQIRFSSSVGSKTAIKFMTDGVLLREIAEDFILKKYSAIIVDEAHERTVNTDMLIGMLTRIVETRAELAKKNPQNKSLKLVIMSATLRTGDFTNNSSLFRNKKPPVVEVEGRQFDVTMHFARRTQRDYLDEMFQKLSRGHKKLPQGGMLVFLTGQGEITYLAKRLKEALPSTKTHSSHPRVQVSAREETVENDDLDLENPQQDSQDEISDEEADAVIRGVDNEEEDDNEFNAEGDTVEALKVHVLPLYSQLPQEQQMHIFREPPDGSRLIVLTTNVAETSLTIPGIRYVFDCGRAKEKKYNEVSGVQTFNITWISKASAEQRAGRAGRTGPGHCYRLYSSAVFDRDFAEFSEPEILKTPIEGVVLQLKSMGIPSITRFPFPTPPEHAQLINAERLLEHLGAISNGKVTDSGKQLAVFPLSPRLSRILLVGKAQNLLSHSIALVAALAVPEIFIPEALLDLRKPVETEDEKAEAKNQENSAREERRKEYRKFHGHMSRLDRSFDALKLLMVASNEVHSSFVRQKAIQEAIQLRRQLTNIVHSAYHNTESFVQLLKEPTKGQVKVLRQVVATGYIDQVAIRADLSPDPPDTSLRPRRAIDVPYLTLFSSSDEARLSHGAFEYVYIHPSSLLAEVAPSKLPQFIVYSHLSETKSRTMSEITSKTAPKIRLHPLTPISGPQLAALAAGTSLIEDGKPIGNIETLPRENGMERRACWVMQSLKGDPGRMPWPLPPARKVIQHRDLKRGWLVEKAIG